MVENEKGQDQPKQRKRLMWMWTVIALMLILPALITWRVANLRPMQNGAPPVAPMPSRAPEPVAEAQRPSVEEGDARLAQLGAGWSKDPSFASLLRDVSLRHLVAAVELVAEGESPRPALPFLSVPGAFTVREEGRANRERRFMTTASFARYDTLGKLIGSIDAGAAGDAYAQLRPYCEAAYLEFGRPGKQFEDELTAAVRRLVNVRFPRGEVELVPMGAVYAYADVTLEALSRAEKQVLRMGPENGGVLQRQLRLFAERAKLNLTPDVR